MDDRSIPTPLRTSRLSGLHRCSAAERRERLTRSRWMTAEDADALAAGVPLPEPIAEAMSENVIGVHALPLAVATNFRIDGRDVLVPMAVEEPSIVAAASFAAKLVYGGGGFKTRCDPPLLACQVQLLDVPDVPRARAAILDETAALLAEADRLIPAMVQRGGGARELEVRLVAPGMLAVHVLIDCRDAMGANLVNTVAEGIAPTLSRLSGGRIGLRILTNLSDRRKVTVRAEIPTAALACERFEDGALVANRIVEAQEFAELDVYRAATHNKGVMNGVDAVLLAFGNDFRAVEAGAHAWAARSGVYQPLTRWRHQEGKLLGELCLPLAASTVGGAARTHPGVARALRLSGVQRGTELAALAAAAGLASNLAALKALSTDGIQRGHMELHARCIAAEVGATGDELERVAARLTQERIFRPERARELLAMVANL